MNKLLAGMIAISSFIFTANAQVEQKQDMPAVKQEGREGMHRGKHVMDKMNLTDLQKQQMKAIQMDFKTKMEALDKNDKMSVKDYKVQKEALMQERKTQMQTVLTQDQKEQMHSMKHDEMKGHGEGAAKLKEANLTKEQRSQLRDQMQAMKSKMDAIKNNASLTPEQKNEQMKALKASNKEAFKNVLTPEQIEKMKAQKNSEGDYK